MPTSVNRRALFREVNERMRDIHDGFGVKVDVYALLCECGRDGCISRVEVPVSVYEELRLEDNAYVVVAGHEPADGAHSNDEAATYRIVSPRTPAADIPAGRMLGLAGSEI